MLYVVVNKNKQTHSIAGKGTTESRESWGFADNNTHPNNVDLFVFVVGVE